MLIEQLENIEINTISEDVKKKYINELKITNG
jgi:hypothetical protein